MNMPGKSLSEKQNMSSWVEKCLSLPNSLKGAWETKISNREKRQQRKKEKGPNDESGSPGGGQQTENPAVKAPVNTKKNKGSLRNQL